MLIVFSVLPSAFLYAQAPPGVGDPNHPSGCINIAPFSSSGGRGSTGIGRDCYGCGQWPTCPASPCFSCYRIYNLDMDHWGIDFYPSSGVIETHTATWYNVTPIFNVETAQFIGFHLDFTEETPPIIH